MNKIQNRFCRTLKDLEAIRENLRKQRIPRARVDIVPCCPACCGVSPKKSERFVILSDGSFSCLPHFLVQVGSPDLTMADIESRFEPYSYGQAVYPLLRYKSPVADPNGTSRGG